MELPGPRADRTFAERVRTERLGAQMSQKRLADGMLVAGFDFTTSTIGKIERQERRVSVAEGLAIAKILGMSLNELIGDEDHQLTWRTVRDLGQSLTMKMHHLAKGLNDADRIAADLSLAAREYDLGVNPDRDPEFETGQGALAGVYFRDLLGALADINVDLDRLRPFFDRFELEDVPDRGDRDE